MDFGSNLAANVAAKVVGRGLIHYAKAHTTNGHITKGFGATSIAIDTLDKHQEHLEEPELKLFAERLALLDNRKRELLEKIDHAKWPWSFLGRAKEFESAAISLKDDVISTSHTAIIKHFSSARVNNPGAADYVESLNMLREAILLLRDDNKTVAGHSVQIDVPADDNDRSSTPTNGSFPPSTFEFDVQITPTDSVFPDIGMTADSAPFPDYSSSITTSATVQDCSSSIMTTDSATPLIPPTPPSPVVQSNQGRGLFGSFARRSAKESFAMKNVKGT